MVTSLVPAAILLESYEMTDQTVSPLARVCILVADDFEPWRIRLRTLLSVRPEWKIICEFCDGHPAVRKATELQPDIVLLDIGMPGLNGIEAARRIRQHSSESKIIFLTQNSDKQILSAALATGANGFVMKANAATELVPAIVAALHKARLDTARLPSNQPNLPVLAH